MDKNFRALPDRPETETFKLITSCILSVHEPTNKLNYGIDQRNLGINLVTDGYIFFLDDDTIIHPNFMSVYKKISNSLKPFTINQHRYEHGEWILRGNNPTPCNIDTGMFCIPRSIIGEVRWQKNIHHNDGVFVNTIWNQHKDIFIFVDEVSSYFNYLNPS